MASFESRCRIRTLGIRGQRCRSPEAGENPASSVGSEGGVGITSGVTGTGTARAPRRRSPQPRLRSVQPKDPPRLGGPSRRCTARPLNLPGDSDAGMARKAAGKSGVRAPGAREQRSPPRLGTALPVPGAERAIGRAPGPGVLPTWPRRHGVGSDSRRGPYRDGGHAGSGQLRGLREPGRGGDEGGGPCGARNRQPRAPAPPGHYNNGGPIKARAPGVARRAPRRRPHGGRLTARRGRARAGSSART